MEAIGSWANDVNLTISTDKTTVTLFTSDPHQSRLHPVVSLHQIGLPLEKFPKILGIKFDTHFTFGRRAGAVAVRASKGLGVLKALAGSSWGHSKETLYATYKAIIQPLFTFGAPIWFPNLAKSHIDRLQRIQTSAMRIITGCHGIVGDDFLHWETKLLPVGVHLQMLCQQFLASETHPGHPFHAIVTSPIHQPRIGTHQELVEPLETLHAAYLDSISPFLTNGIMRDVDYKPALKSLHSCAVQHSIVSLDPNRVLGVRPPKIDASELSLPRDWRCTLSQLRSGFSKTLRTCFELVRRTICVRNVDDTPLLPTISSLAPPIQPL